MTETGNTFALSDKAYFLTRTPRELYRLEKGRVQIYIVTLTEAGKPEDPVFFCELKDTDRQRPIPAFAYTDETGRSWSFLVRTEDAEATLSMYDSGITTAIPLKNLLKRQGLTVDDSLALDVCLDQFCQVLMAFYHSNWKDSGAETITLGKTDSHITENPDDVYVLEKGTVFVDIVSMERGHVGGSLLYCEITDTDSLREIPALSFRDANYKQWRLRLRTKSEEAVLTRRSGGATEELHRAFLERGKLDTYEREGYERSLLEFYNRREVIDTGILQKGEGAEKRSGADVHGLMGGVLKGDEQKAQSDSKLYQALAFVCGKRGIGLVSPEELYSRCGENPDVPGIAKASHFICRKIVLDSDWLQFDFPGFVGKIDKEIVGCTQDKNGKYQLYRSSDGSVVPLTPELAAQISPEVYSVGRTLPLKPLTKKDVVSFCARSILPRDLVPYVVLVIACALIGVLLPTLNGMIYDDYIPVGNVGNLTEICVVLLSFMVGNLSFSIVKNMRGYRMTSRVSNELQNAVYHRLFHLPEAFFRKFDSADLAERVSCIGAMAGQYANTLIISGISALFSIFYLIRMFTYNGKLTWLALGMYAVYILIVVAITATVHKGQMRIAEAESEAGSKLYQYLNGVDKIRMAGVESKALLSYMRPYARKQTEEIRVNRLISIEEALTTVVQFIFSMVLYWFIVKKLSGTNLSIGVFTAFNSAFGAFTGALGGFVDEAMGLFQQRNEIRRVWDVFDSVPEDDDSKEVPGELSGRIKLQNITFAYDKGGKNVLDGIDIDIEAGDYVGIVGPSGCGKSTLLKLLLGFETPDTGMVMVDQKDLRTLNKGAYRRQLGVVLQNGRLISGSIFENITITAPEANMKRVNEVVRQVGLKEDIDRMPMGLHTMLSESSNTISGGQQQRILIARAICGNPKILIFDEATSALDNMTQAAVSASLDKMNVTRIVVAHRLSTIRNCRRILVLDGGKVIQEGNYETLMQDENGLFYQLASRQIAE